MSDHTVFRDTQEERAEHQLIEQSRRMRKERDTAVAALRKLVESYDACFDPDSDVGTADRLQAALDVARDVLGIEV